MWGWILSWVLAYISLIKSFPVTFGDYKDISQFVSLLELKEARYTRMCNRLMKINCSSHQVSSQVIPMWKPNTLTGTALVLYCSSQDILVLGVNIPSSFICFSSLLVHWIKGIMEICHPSSVNYCLVLIAQSQRTNDSSFSVKTTSTEKHFR